ncbi:MAG TPA: cytochrome c [candidate division Zixibacteria bacterium]|nr:cytochrome c [candidate division Zixibacteria bacterium]
MPAKINISGYLNQFAFILLLIVAVSLAGCYQGQPSKNPPIHINPNMDDQPKFQAQSSSSFFENGQAMRKPIPGTVARGQLREDVVYYTGKDVSGKLVKKSPVPASLENIKRGQDRFNIYCAACHGKVGDGVSMVVKRGMFPPANFSQERLVKIEDGHFFDVMSNGLRNMPAYKSQIPVSDRWAIINYIRVLQRSQTATAKDVPAEVKAKLQ